MLANVNKASLRNLKTDFQTRVLFMAISSRRSRAAEKSTETTEKGRDFSFNISP